MRRKISAILVTVLIMLTVMPMGAFAAVPSVQEVETLIAQIGTVTRENRSAVEKAVNAYNQLDDASKAGVSNFDVLAEAQQILGIKDALAKLNVEHDRCRVVRLGDLGERKKRPHLVENQISKSLKELFK